MKIRKTLRWFHDSIARKDLRIFANLMRLKEDPPERILLIIGSGHLPIIRHSIQASPEYELVEVASVLR